LESLYRCLRLKGIDVTMVRFLLFSGMASGMVFGALVIGAL
jgi:hypothetical protein